ncbi:MAG: PD40 domain-containing protein [Anaerolineae bacterium]|nr:PD40 domain-containing protein [Anaerolineae bacterium]
MSGQNQTVYTGGGAPAPAATNRRPLLIVGGLGCVLLLCIALLIGGGLFFARDRLNDIAGLGGGEATPVVETPTVIMPTATLEPSPTVETPIEPTVEQADTGETPPLETKPVIGMITFALDATADYEPIDPGTSFAEGITVIHAIFDYSGMLSSYTWERVWYLDGSEILRNSAAWTDSESGRFDYFIDAGGDPLSPGEWTLELYVNDELLSKGTFTIKGAELPVAAAADTPTPTKPALPEATPTKPSLSEVSPGGGGGSSGGGGGVYQLVYTKWDGGQHNMYVADTNGNNEQFIMNRAAGPSWTPDGQTIFFFGEAGVGQQDRSQVPGIGSCDLPGVSDGIVAIDFSSAPADICVTFPGVRQGPGWNDGTARWTSVSLDGQMVAYDAKPGGDYRIYFLGTTDNQQFRFEIVGEQADWSPDSQKIVYRSGRDGKTGIWISNRDDSGHTPITSVGSDSFPAWSPDGQTIAFSRDEGGNVDIYTMNVDGSNVQRLTDAPGPDSLPIYTPSGDIIFRSARSGAWGIWKMSGSGANQTEIIPNAGVGPDWAKSKMDVR